MIKRVGDGTDIRVWEDPWIPATHSRLPVVRKPEANVTMVNELIDEDQLCWNKQKIIGKFYSYEFCNHMCNSDRKVFR
jgi:hypothetical protein